MIKRSFYDSLKNYHIRLEINIYYNNYEFKLKFTLEIFLNYEKNLILLSKTNTLEITWSNLV